MILLQILRIGPLNNKDALKELKEHLYSLQDFADKLGVDAFGISSVVTDLRKDAGVNVDPKPPTDVQVSSLDPLYIRKSLFKQRTLIQLHEVLQFL